MDVIYRGTNINLVFLNPITFGFGIERNPDLNTLSIFLFENFYELAV